MRTLGHMEILYIENDDGDIALAREVLQDAGLPVSLHVAMDGETALAYLYRKEPFTAAVRPDLIWLDLNLPGMTGDAVLRHIKSEPALKSIPVMILTTSDADADIVSAYASGASCYVKKPEGLDAFSQMIHWFESFWLNAVQLPPRP